MGKIYVTPQAKIEKYFKSKAISQSYLKGLSNGLDNFLFNQKKEEELFYKEKKNLIIGSAVDTMLIAEEGQFEKEYYVSQIENKLSDIEMSIVQMVYDDVKRLFKREQARKLSKYLDSIEMSIHEHKWQPNWKSKTKIDKIIEIGNEYFEDLKKANDRQIISESERILIEDIANSLITNRRTSKYFDRNQYLDDIDIYYQLPIYFNFKTLKCKALLDIVFIFKNPDTNKIESIQPLDLKTMSGSTFNFINNVRKYRYDIQAAFYTLAIKHWMKQKGFVSNKYMIKPFQFIVESTTLVGNPLIFKCGKNLMDIGKSGRSQTKLKDLLFEYTENVGEILLQKEIKGYEQLINDYLYYSKNEWKEERVVAENDGVLTLDYNGIITGEEK